MYSAHHIASAIPTAAIAAMERESKGFSGVIAEQRLNPAIAAVTIADHAHCLDLLVDAKYQHVSDANPDARKVTIAKSLIRYILHGVERVFARHVCSLC